MKRRKYTNLEDIKNNSQLTEVLEDMSWQNFEVMVGKIFEIHDYDVTVSKVITFEDSKHQYDIIARGKNQVVIADCKKWDNRRKIKHGLKRAARKQVNRVKKMDCEEKYPIIITSDSSPIEFYEEIPIIPVHKLNSFISEFQKNKERLLRL